MAKQNKHFAHFSVGEYSAAGLARVDVARTLLAAEIQENVFPHAVGKGQVRPGTTYLGTTPDNERVRLIPFVRDIDDVALIEMSAGALRVWVNDAPVTRAAVTSTVTNGDFSSATGWTLSASSGAHATISGGKLTMDADARGSLAYCEQSVSTSSAGTEHALRIIVSRGPVLFRCGSSSGAQDYISETSLDTGVHSLAFTPSSSPYYIRFLTRNPRDCIVDSVTVESAGIMELSAPWTAAQLREISFDQSADVIFLAHAGWQQRKIERRSTTSWSLATYQSNDGPFTYPESAGVTVRPSATYGNITLTANRPAFDPNMVGSVVRLYHPNLKGTWRLGGDGEFTDVFQVRGIKGERFNDRTFYYQVSGSWSGTMRVQRSLTGPDGDFVDYNIDDGVTATTFTSNRSVTHVGQEEDNNVLAYFRIGFIDGAYTSGNAVVSVQYTGFGGYGVGRITGYQSETKVSVEVLENFNSTDATDSWEIGQWSNYYGWPSAVALFDGRLWWGGTDTFWGSASDAYYTYDDLESGDSATIKRQVATGGQINQINWFLPLQRLLIGTTGSISSARASSFDEPLTPNGVTVKDAATFGGSTVSPIKLDSRGIFVHRSTQSVNAMLYSVDANDYAPRGLTGNSDGICGDGIVEIAASREPETYVWCVREDGEIAMLIYEYAEGLDVEGWSRFVTNGVVESVCVLPGANEDDVYIAVDRTNEEEIITTGAEVLARGESAAWDFTDQSAYVLDNTTPANNENTYGGQTDGYGTPIGPDANIVSYTASNSCDPKMLLLPSGFLGYQPHNFVTESEDLSDPSWLKENVWISSETYEAPDGTMTARKVVMQNVGSAVAHSLRTVISRDSWAYNSGSSANRTRLELSFWAKPQVQSSSWSRWISASFTDQTVVGGTQTASSNETFNVAIGSTDNLGLVELASSGGKTGVATWRDADGFIEAHDNGWYRFNLYIASQLEEIALEFNFYTGSDDGSEGSSTFLGDDYAGPLIWGVQVNMIPNIDFHNERISTYVKTSGNPRILLPYAYTNAGALRGIRVEPQTKNILSHDRTFTTAPYALSNATLTSGENSPNMMFDGTILTESGSTSPHYLEYPFVGPNDLYALSLYVKTAELNNVALQLISATEDRYLANFNIANGIVVDEIVTGATNTRSGIELLTSGWARVWISSDVITTLPAAMISSGTSSASFIEGPPAHIEGAGFSTATFGGIFYSGGGTIADAGTSTASFVSSTEPGVFALLGNLGFDDTDANFSTNIYTYTGLRPWYIIEPSRFGFYNGPRNGVVPVDGRPASTVRNMIYDLGTGTTETDAEIQQTGTLLDSGVTASQIDGGEVYFSFWGYTADDSINTPTANQARVIIEYLNAAQNVISNALDTGWYAHSVDDTWEQYSVVNDNIPSGARYVRVRLFARNNNTGGFSNFGAGIYFDGMSYELMTDASDVQMISNGSFEAGQGYTTSSSTTTTSGPFDWTRVTGSSLCYFYSSPNSLSAQHGQRYIQGATTNLELRQDVTLLTRYDGLLTGSDIDNGVVTFDFSGYMANSFTLDTGRILVEFRDSGGTVISTAYDTGTIEITPTLTWTQKSASGVPVPVNTRIISFRLFANLVSGTYANVNFDNLTASLTITPIPTLAATGTAGASFSGQDATPTEPFTSAGSAAALFAGLDATPTVPLTVAGTSAAAFAGAATALSDLSSAGTSTMTFYDAYNGNATLSVSGIATTSMSPIISATMSGTASVLFKNANAVLGTISDGGTSTAAFVSLAKVTQSMFRVYLVESDEPVINAQDSPVHESTGSSLVIWGAQLEYGRNSASTFATIAGQTTRAGDVYNTPLTDVPWDQTQVTLYVEAEQIDENASGSLGSETTGPAFGVDSGGDDVHFLRSDTARDMRYEILNNGAVEASIDGGTWTVDTTFELASSATTNDARLVVDHGSATQDASVTMPTIPQSGSLVVFGHSDDGAYNFDGILKRAALIMDVSTDEELQDLGNPEDPPTMRFIEKLNLRSEAIGSAITKMADAGIYAAGPVSSVTASWLAERTNLVGWGTKVSDGLTYPLTGLSADTSGVIALGDTYTMVFVGLGYDARYKTGKLAYAATGGTALLQRKRVGEMSLLLANTHRDAVRFGADFETMRKMDLIKGGAPQAATTVNAVYDEIGFSFPGEWSTDARLCLKVSAPYPCTFLGLVIAVETNERGLG